MGENSIPSQNIARFPLIFFLGFIVLVLAEIMAGSSLLWFLDLSGYFITIPFYIVQVLCFWNLAIHTGRTRPVELYLWGIILGLSEESWYTKVIFSGATSATTSLFWNIYGFGIVEFLILVLFWHPTMTFITTLCIVESIGSANLPSHPLHFWNMKSGKNKARFFMLSSFSAIIITVFAQQNLLAIVAPEILTFAAAGLFGIIAKKQMRRFENEYFETVSPTTSLIFSRSGTFCVVIVTILFYVVGFFQFRTFAIPPIQPLIITAILYLPLLILLFGKKKGPDIARPIEEKEPESNCSIFQGKDFVGFFLWFLILSVVGIIIPAGYMGILSWIGYFLYALLGILNFLRIIINRFH